MRFVLALIAVLFFAVPGAFAQEHTDHSSTPAVDTHTATPAGDAHGEDAHGAAHADPSVIPAGKEALVMGIATVVVFLIVLIVLGTQVWPKITKGLDERAEKIRSEIASAEAARKQAKDALEQYEASLAEARAEAQKMLEDAKEQQAKLSAELRAKADQDLAELRERAKNDIEAAKRAAVNDIYGQAATLATTLAGKILKREVADADHQSLLEESLAELKDN